MPKTSTIVFVAMIATSIYLLNKPGGDFTILFRLSMLIIGIGGLLISNHYRLKRRAELLRAEAEEEQKRYQNEQAKTESNQSSTAFRDQANSEK